MKRKGSRDDLFFVDIGGNRAEVVEETVRDPTLEGWQQDRKRDITG